MKSSLHFPRHLVFDSDQNKVQSLDGGSFLLLSPSRGLRGEHHPAFCSVVLGVSVLRLYYRGPLSICCLDGPQGETGSEGLNHRIVSPVHRSHHSTRKSKRYLMISSKPRRRTPLPLTKAYAGLSITRKARNV